MSQNACLPPLHCCHQPKLPSAPIWTVAAASLLALLVRSPLRAARVTCQRAKWPHHCLASPQHVRLNYKTITVAHKVLPELLSPRSSQTIFLLDLNFSNVQSSSIPQDFFLSLFSLPGMFFTSTLYLPDSYSAYRKSLNVTSLIPL